jgi:predicted HTH domain antitoxin
MTTLALDIPDHLLIVLNESEDSLKLDIKYEFSKNLFKKGKFTLSQGAEFAGIDLKEFMNKISRDGIPVIDYPSEDLNKELEFLK